MKSSPFQKPVPQEFGGLAWLVLANGPAKAKFEPGLTFVKAGRLTLLVRYPSRMVGVYRTDLQTGNFGCVSAINPSKGKGPFKPFKYQPLKAASERAEAAFVEGKLLPSTEPRLPRLYQAFEKVPDPADCSIAGLQELAGSSDGADMVETFYRVLRRFGAFTMMPLPLVEILSRDSIFESLEGLIGHDGHGRPQAVYADCLRRHGLGEENLSKVVQTAGG
jgi:hypothetical protein